MYKIILHKRVIKFINNRNSKEKQRIKEKFKQLQQNPYPANMEIDSKKLQNRNGFRLRAALKTYIAHSFVSLFIGEAQRRRRCRSIVEELQRSIWAN